MSPSRRDISLIAVFVLSLVGCTNTPGGSREPSPDKSGVIVVKTATPKRQSLRWEIEQPGTVSAYESTPILTKIPGFIREIAPDIQARQQGNSDAVIDLGSVVVKDQLLATLAIPELAEEQAQKRAAVEQARAEYEQIRKDIAVADAQVAAAKAAMKEAEAAVARATAEFDRWKTELAQADDLVVKKVIDTQSRAVTFKQFQTAEASRFEAQAKVTTAAVAITEKEAKRLKADADVLAGAARVAVAEAAVKEVDARVSYTRITAPFNGVVTERRIHTGHFVQPMNGNQGMALFVVARLDLLRVTVDVPEAAASKAVTGAKVLIRIPGLGYEEFTGTIARNSGVMIAETRSLRTEIDLPNPKRLIQPGSYASVRILAETADATMLPAACILAADESHAVYLVEGGKAVKYRVRIGRTEGGLTQMLAKRAASTKSGEWLPFSGNEKAVLGNLGALADGVEVSIED